MSTDEKEIPIGTPTVPEGTTKEEPQPKRLFLDEMGEIPNSCALPAPTFDDAARKRGATVVGAQVTRMMGSDGAEGFILTLTCQYNGQAQPTVGILIAHGEDMLQARVNLFVQTHKTSGKPLAQAFNEKLIDPDAVTPDDFVNKHWQVMEPVPDYDLTWEGAVKALVAMLPKVFDRMDAVPTGDAVPGQPC